jgi:hypothetical protein
LAFIRANLPHAQLSKARIWIPGPFCKNPKVSAGAGDHFKAGFSLGKLIDLPPVVCLAAGVATSGFYVRNATNPMLDELSAFLTHQPAFEDIW